MSRIRTIKPDFWEDEKVGQLPIPCRLFFIGCWNFADDFGVIKGNAALLKSQIFPYDENLRVSEIKRWIDALVNARMLIPIIHAEESYYIIRTFRSHQVLDNRYSKSYISKDKTLVSKIVNEAINDNIVNTSSTQCVHNVITTEEMEIGKEDKENNSDELLKKYKLSSTTKSERMDWGAFMQTFNDMLSPAIPRIQSLSESRRQKVKAIIKTHGKEKIMKVFEIIRNSDFLLGHNNSGWRCDFDWIFKPNNFVKILEGNYTNGASSKKTNEQICVDTIGLQTKSLASLGINGTAESIEEFINGRPFGG